MHVPKADDQRSRAGVQKPANQAHQFVASHDLAHARSTSAERHELCGSPEVVDIEQAEPGISQLDGAEHRVVVSERTMARNMDQSGAG